MDRPRLCLLALPPPVIPPPPLLLPPVVQDIEVRPPPLPPRLDEILTTRPNAPYGGNDVFSRLRNHEMDFWYMTGETVASFQQIVEDIRPLLDDETERHRPHLLSVENRVWSDSILSRQLYYRGIGNFSFCVVKTPSSWDLYPVDR